MTKLEFCGQKLAYEMQSHKPEIQTLADVCTNLQKEPETPTEFPISMNVSLPPCWVVLHRLTCEEINRRYPDESISDHSNFDLSSDSYDSFYQAFEKNCKQRRLRPLNKLDNDAFEQYKKHREQFRNKRKSQEYSDEGGYNDLEAYKSHKRKKRAKRAKKYEQDSEWNPHIHQSLGGSKKRRVRRPAIESDTSSSDDEEDLYDYFMNEKNEMDNYNDLAIQNSVPSDFAASSKLNKELDKNPLNNDLQRHNDSNVQNPSNYSGLKNGDILSGIMKEMDDFAKGNVYKSSQTVITAPCDGKVNPTKRGRKRRISNTSNNIEVVARNVIQQLVNKVCAKQKFQNEKPKNNICKWCNSHFQSSHPSEILCAICNDLGNGKIVNKPNKINILKKQLPANKLGKKSSRAMSQMLKTLPKSEKQRLMYSEKKSPSNKSYNHCKSSVSVSDGNLNPPPEMLFTQNNVEPHDVSGALNTEPKSTVKVKKCIKITDDSLKPKTIIDESTPFNIKKLSTTGEILQCDNGGVSNKISLKKFDEGLFHQSFPGCDDDLNIVSTKTSSALQKENSNKLSSCDGSSCATESFNSTVSCNEITSSKQNSQDNQYKTYLLPPVPTVLIANYSSASDNGNYCLSSIFYQNEYTQKHSVKDSASANFEPKAVSMTPVINTLGSPNQNASLAPVTFNNQALSVSLSKVSLDDGLNQIQSLRNSCLPVVTSSAPLATSAMLSMPVVSSILSAPSIKNTVLAIPFVNSVVPAPSVTNTVLSMPIVSSVVSLCNKNEDKIPTEDSDIFLPKNFVNSEQLQIKITSVASERQVETEKSNQFVNKEDPQKLRDNFQNVEVTPVKDTPLSKTDLSTSSSIPEPVKQIFNANTHKEVSQDNSEKLISKPKDAINSAIDLLGAISILAVMDLDSKSPHAGLDIQIQMAKSQLAKLNSEKNAGTEHTAKITSCQYNLELLITAKKFLKRYGSFTKVSEFLLRKHQMIQIKKEKMDEEEEETSQKACRFSESSSIISSINNQEQTVSDFLHVSQTNSQAISHIEKLQSQIAAMNNAQLQMNQNFSLYDKSNTGTVHHFGGEQFSALAPTPITPRNDIIGGEARETPSRGSGPRTPARPESATSQPDELAITALKKELMEVTTSSPSQCAFSQNPSLSQISSQISLQEMTSIANNITSQAVNDSGSRMYVTKPPPLYNQTYSNVLLNLASKQVVSTGVESNGQVLIGQPLCVPNTTVLPQRQTVPSVNNQFVIQPSLSNSHSVGGAVLLNAAQVPTQNVNALLTNVSNQQFYTSSQVPQMFYPQQQLSSLQSNVSPIATNQPSPIETKEQMYCAVCKSIATLRCKQCAKVAYCNTTCAKTYWHQRHKMECKPV